MTFTDLKKNLLKLTDVNKLLKSSIAYNIVVVLAILNIAGYVFAKNLNAIVVFTLTYLLTNCMTNNITLSLLISVFSSNLFFMGNKLKEGMQTESGTGESGESGTGDNVKTEQYVNPAVPLQPKELSKDDFKSDNDELAKQLKILNEQTKSSMGMISNLGGIGNITKMVDNLTGIVAKIS
jgi:hypothetical protein